MRVPDGSDGWKTFPAVVSGVAVCRRGRAMPPFALVLCAAAALLGTLAASAQELSLDLRAAVTAGLAGLAVLSFTAACKAPRLSALLVMTFLAAAANAMRVVHARVEITPQRTAQYRG